MEGGWHIFHDNQQLGPYAVSYLQQLFENGQIQDTTYVWSEGSGLGWKQLSTIPELFAAVAAGHQEIPEDSLWHVHHEGENLGPYPFSDVRQGYFVGTFEDTTPVWSQAWGWRTLSSIPMTPTEEDAVALQESFKLVLEEIYNDYKTKFQDLYKAKGGTRLPDEELMNKYYREFVKLSPVSMEVTDALAPYILTGLESAYYQHLRICGRSSGFKYVDFKQFFIQALKHCPIPYVSPKVEIDLFNFREHKRKTVVAGCIIFSEDGTKCLVASPQWLEYSNMNTMSFIRGKVDTRILIRDEGSSTPREETILEAAQREVKEETGLNIYDFIDVDNPIIVTESVHGRQMSMIIVTGVPEDHPTIQRQETEIKELKWWPLTKFVPKAKQVPMLELLRESDPDKIVYYENDDEDILYEVYQFLSVLGI